ncbi:hypothetical protein NDU88_000520 [Pleurodeles waltl]|uniref:Uncharacterized protein n=1 Tax=Pleurodeles waltl TaxID=8319 RepID=A0AAV7KM84_PLEWA|nr:hypothetical protein NDU88_000520 [Pleurodeles waltl]
MPLRSHSYVTLLATKWFPWMKAGDGRSVLAVPTSSVDASARLRTELSGQRQQAFRASLGASLRPCDPEEHALLQKYKYTTLTAQEQPGVQEASPRPSALLGNAAPPGEFIAKFT